MKPVNVSEIKSTTEFIAKKVKTKLPEIAKTSDNPTAFVEAQQAVANSVRAGLSLNLVTKDMIFSRYRNILEEFDYAKPLKKFISRCEDGSKELADIETILAHCQPNKNGINLFDKKLFNFIKSDKKIPDAISKDLEVLRKSGKLIDNYIPEFATKEEALKTVKTGDVFQIKGDKTVSIRNRKGEIENLSMDKNSYFELFPPVQRFTNIQPDFFGICYEVTALNAVLENPASRENLLRTIDTVSQKGKINIKFPNSNFKDGITFLDKDVTGHNRQDLYASGCTGFKYIEYALGKEYEKAFIDYEVPKLIQKGDREKAQTIQKLYAENKLEKLAEYCGSDRKCTLGERLREAGDAIVPWKILGFENNGSIEMGCFTRGSGRGKTLIDDYRWADKYKTSKIINDEEVFAEKLWSPEFFDKHLVEAYVGDSETESMLSKWHSYRLLPVLDEAGKVDSYLIKDPHTMLDRKISFDDIFETIDSISFSEIK